MQKTKALNNELCEQSKKLEISDHVYNVST